jgi:pimeloyl-ACP methyl ester carboxylesterase
VLRDDPRHQAVLAASRAAMAETAALIEAGEAERAVELFVERVAFGPGVWAGTFTAEQRATMVANADTWLDQFRDPDRLALPLGDLAGVTVPVVVTRGDRSPAIYGPTLDRLLEACPTFGVRTIAGAGHAAPLTHPAELAEIVRAAPTPPP